MDRVLVDSNAFNPGFPLPYGLTQAEISAAMQEVYDYFLEINDALEHGSLPRLEAEISRAILSGVVTNLFVRALARHAATLVRNEKHNGFPAILPAGAYPHNQTAAGADGIEVKSTSRGGAGLERHGARAGYKCLIRYREPVGQEGAPTIMRINLAHVDEADFEHNPRGNRGTPTYTLRAEATDHLRGSWVYRVA